MASYCCRDEPLTVQAPGTQTRSFCYVSDMVCKCFLITQRLQACKTIDHELIIGLFLIKSQVDGLIRLMEGEHTGPINIGNPGEFVEPATPETGYHYVFILFLKEFLNLLLLILCSHIQVNSPCLSSLKL